MLMDQRASNGSMKL